jgi:integrase/recombinase XerC
MTTSKANTTVAKAVADFIRHLRERNASPHTVKAYSHDLSLFAAYAGSRGWKQIDHIAVRGFLSQLYGQGLSKTSVARALAAVRSLFRWLAREGVVEQNPARLVATPRLPKKLPRVPTIEEMNSVIDGEMPEVAAFPERDRLMLELLYGCGIRNSELTGINLDDIRLSAEAILIRGKGKKERYVPFGDSVKAALATYLPERQKVLEAIRKQSAALLINRRGGRLPTRCVMPSEPTCWKKALTCAPFRSYLATSASRPRSDTRSFR